MIIVLLADGFEEIEALTPVDVLRRAGLSVKTVGINGRAPTGAHGISVVCDATPEEIDLSAVTMAIFPGGMPGALNLDKSEFTAKVISAVCNSGGRLAAICAAPLVFGRRGLLQEKKATCYPGFEKELWGATVENADVVTDGNITTARGMGVALAFAEELLTLCLGKDRADEISSTLCKHTESLPTMVMEQDENDASLAVEEKEETDDIPPRSNEQNNAPDYSSYVFPSLDYLAPDAEKTDDSDDEIQKNASIILDTLNDFGITASIKGVDKGNRITRYEIVPSRGVKVSRIVSVNDDIALRLRAVSLRTEAPIPGQGTIGMEIPHKNPTVAKLRNLLETKEFKSMSSTTAVAVGRDVTGQAVLGDIAKMPHILIGGATGMGKSVFINSLILSVLYKARPDEVKFIMIDPKQVEFLCYKDLPHLLTPVITEPKEAAAALKWLVKEMDYRYRLLERLSVRNIDAYNEAIKEKTPYYSPLPKIVVVIDELADLMLQVKEHVESNIARIAQKARAAGIYLVIGTQRPSVNVITGILKANIPSRLCCRVISNVDSKVMLDTTGAEKLLGQGDALYMPAGSTRPMRIQVAYATDSEIDSVVEHIKATCGSATYDPLIIDYIKEEAKKLSSREPDPADEEASGGYLNDAQFLMAVNVAVSTGKVSTSLIQRKLSIGYGKAAKFIDIMEEMGIVGGADGVKPRNVLLTPQQWEEKLKRASDD